MFGISMAMSGAIVACGGDEEKAATTPTGAVGESCTRRADCSSGLICLDQVCQKKGGSATGGTGGSGNEAGSPGSGGTGGSAGGAGGKGTTTGGTGGKGTTTGGAGGTTGGTGPAPVLGGLGESCTRAADCEEGLGCFNNRCAMAATGEGGGGNIPEIGGGIGETCLVSADCEDGLACLPKDTMLGTIGICTPSNTGVQPTGKICGAECTQPADCCELPIELHSTLNVKSCTELRDMLNGVDCSAPDTYTEECFANAAYCGSCGAKWSCTSGMCLYTADCMSSGLVINGCPTVSRAGNALVSTCSTDGKCEPPMVSNGCDTPADCEDGPPTDDPGDDNCAPGECVCYNKSVCLRKCDKDLDCAFGKICSTTDKVCIDAAQCDSDETCQRILGDYRATCSSANACTIPCDTDLDCSGAGLVGGNLTEVCENGTCQPIGCNDDSECKNQLDVTNMAANPRKMFCTTPTVGVAGKPAGYSAITD